MTVPWFSTLAEADAELHRLVTRYRCGLIDFETVLKDPNTYGVAAIDYQKPQDGAWRARFLVRPPIYGRDLAHEFTHLLHRMAVMSKQGEAAAFEDNKWGTLQDRVQGDWWTRRYPALSIVGHTQEATPVYAQSAWEILAYCGAALIYDDQEALALDDKLDRAKMAAFFDGLFPADTSVSQPDTAPAIADPAGYLLSFPLTQPFGVPEPQAPSGFHTGIDLGLSSGTPVPALRAGVVRYMGYDATSGYSLQYITADGWLWWLAHLSKFASGLAVGQPVARGQVLAYSGASGNVTGPHLHLEAQKPIGTPIDPYEEVVMLSQETKDYFDAKFQDILTKLDSGFNVTVPTELNRQTAGDRDVATAPIDK